MRCNVEVVLKMEQTQNTEARVEARVNWNASGPATRDNAKEVLETRLSCLSRGTAIIHDLHFPTSPQPHFPTLQTLPPPTHTPDTVYVLGPLCNAVLWYTTVCASTTAEKHLLSREQNMLPGGHGHGVYMQHDTRTDHFPVERRCRRLWFQWLSALSTLLTYCMAGCAEMLIGIVASRPDD